MYMHFIPLVFCGPIFSLGPIRGMMILFSAFETLLFCFFGQHSCIYFTCCVHYKNLVEFWVGFWACGTTASKKIALIFFFLKSENKK